MSSTEPQPLYAPREPIFPRRVKGFYRNLKWWVMGITLSIYYLTPWIRWDRGPNLPDQAVLIDMAHRRFYFFWIEILPHGYTCPQTVWTDLFILVERWIEGDRNARVRLWNADWSFRKVRLRTFKWAVWLLISVATGGAWVFYFADAPTLAVSLATFNAPLIAWATIGVLTATTFVFGGFMREQVCNYMCPWPRIQAAMMDPETLTVAYREWRGEPRGKKRIKGAGDCIDCMACVNVCPAGIDIRDGQQMECITCALCIDACDDVMDRIGKPRGLIDYLALSDQDEEAKGKQAKRVWQHVLRFRTILYTTLWALIGVGLIFALFIRADIEMTVAPVRNPTFVTLSDGTIRNIYDIRLLNKHGEDREFHLSLTSDSILRIELEGTSQRSLIVPANETFLQRVYASARPDDPAATVDRTDLRFWVEDRVSGERAHKDVIFNGRTPQ
jgi:cytochrome c oxidase accessory protein FixG